MISTWFLFFTFFSNIFITNSIIPYSLKKAQPKLDFFNKLRGCAQASTAPVLIQNGITNFDSIYFVSSFLGVGMNFAAIAAASMIGTSLGGNTIISNSTVASGFFSV